MTFEIRKTAEFETDVDKALEYIVASLKSPRAALGLTDELERAFDNLKENPYLAAISRKPILRSHECRERLARRYVIVYKIESGTVYLLGFYHQMQLYEYRFLDRSSY